MLVGLGVGAVLLVVFLIGAGIVAQVPALREPVEQLLAHARWGSLPIVVAITALNGGTMVEILSRPASRTRNLRRPPARAAPWSTPS